MPATTQDPASVLPAELTSFVGRRHEIAETRRLLGASHLVTLTGPGGVGKTRLALRVGGGLQRSFPDGIRLVELADLRDPSLLTTTMAEKLGIRDRSSRASIDALLEHLGSRRLLLILDNCEHLVEACARVVEQLLRSCPNLRILATSRQSLGVCGEATLHIPPLPTPASNGSANGSVQNYDAVQMFVDRAHAVAPTFRLDEHDTASVARLCEALDGIPLAIELAAVRLRVLSLDQLEDRLDDRYRLLTSGVRNAPARQQTLRAAIDWSYELCSREEQLLWARLSVFSGGFDLDAIEYVCVGPDESNAGDGIAAEVVLDLVDGLVDKSVVMHEVFEGRARYRLLETIREYGHEKLAETGSVAGVRARHRDWYEKLTTAFERDWLGPDQIAWVARMRREEANLRVALDYCLTTPGEAATGLRMATRLDDYWGILGKHTEARHWLDGVLAASTEPSPERVSGLRMSGWFALLQGEIEVGQRLLSEAAELAERTANRAEAAYVQHALGLGAMFAGDLDAADTLVTRSLAGFREAGVLRGELFALLIEGLTLGEKGEVARGLALVDECLALSTRCREVFWRSYALWAKAYLAVLSAGDDAAAAEASREALRYKRQLGDQLGLAFTMDILAWVASRQERHKRAAVLFGAASAIWESLASSPANYPTFCELHDKYVGLSRSALGSAAYDSAFRQGREMTGDTALDLALEEGPGEDEPEPPHAVVRPAGSLTRREQQIAELIADGMTNREIAQHLVIAVRTAEGHVEHILSKLGFSSRAQIAAWVASRRGGPPDEA